MKFYEFKVLPFGLTSAPYAFTKVVRQLVKYWRGCGHLTLMYLDDGIGGICLQSVPESLAFQFVKILFHVASRLTTINRFGNLHRS